MTPFNNPAGIGIYNFFYFLSIPLSGLFETAFPVTKHDRANPDRICLI